MQHTYFTPQEVAGQGTKRFKCPIHGGSKRSVAVGYIDGRVWAKCWSHPRPRPTISVKGGEKVYHCGGGIVYHRHDEKGLNWEPGGIRSGAGVCKSGVSQKSSGSSETWEAALCRLCLRR